MRIPDADPGDQNHADPCGCGSATLVKTFIFSQNLHPDPFQGGKPNADSTGSASETTAYARLRKTPEVVFTEHKNLLNKR
jgi:hypothetical protein